ncbi:hypothetical protein AWZ03_014472, partial [Drosophila navojoa]
MARKKSLHDGDANRFKSVNYDRNLRNIKAKGEVNPPGMDEGNNKAAQTLDAWAQVALDYIRGNENSINLQNAHKAWQKDLDERIRKKNEWDKQFKERNTDAQFSSFNRKTIGQSPCLSAPNSPTSPIQHHLPKEKSLRTASAILSSSSHFLSNFWHANSNDPSSTQSLKYGNISESHLNSDKNETTNMQKSKSLSNVGHFVSKKFWGSRFKCQNRQSHSHDFVAQQQKWTPLEKYSWISEEGHILQLTDTSLEKLSNIEAEVLMHIALQKIKELNIGMSIDLDRSKQKTRVISKKRALTTSFFDIGRKDEHNSFNYDYACNSPTLNTNYLFLYPDRIRMLREEFDKNCNMRIPDNTCPHDVATLLKEFLRDLPEPLLCKRLYTTFLETQRIRNRRLQLEAISHLIKLLPIAHRDTLYVLLKFLGNVAAHCDNICNPDGTVHIIGNKMDSNNLSTVFAPNILRDYPPKSGECKEQGNMADAINVIRIMIDHYEEIFRIPVDLVDLLYTHMLDTCPQQLNILITSKIIQSPTTQ